MRLVATGLILAASAWTPTAAQTPPPASLQLVCDGRATFKIPNLDWDKEKKQFGDDRRVDTAGRVGLKIEGPAVKVRLPSGVPGGGGWRDADRVVVNPDSIQGRVGGATFNVDRHTGSIEMTGRLAFSGSCEKAPDETAPAKF